MSPPGKHIPNLTDLHTTAVGNQIGAMGSLFRTVLQVFDQLLTCKALPLKTRLRCLLSIVEIIHEQGDTLAVDRRTFYIHLYSALFFAPLSQPLPTPADDAPASADAPVVSDTDLEALRESRGDAAPAVTSSGKGPGNDAKLDGKGAGKGEDCEGGEESVSVLLIKTAHAMLLDLKVGDAGRVAAFAKRTCSLAMHADADVSLATISILNRCALHFLASL